MALNDNLQLISYLTAAEAFDQGKNIFDSFLPILESTLVGLAHKESISFLALQKELNDNYFLSVPKTTLRCLLEKLHQQGKIFFLDRKKIIPNKGKLNQAFWEKRDDREMAVEDFFLEFNSFLTQKDIEIPLPEIKSQSCNWLYLHSLEIATFISKGKLEIKKPENDWAYANQLVSFLLQLYSTKSTHYDTFLYIYNGAVQASLLNFDPEQIDSLCEINLKLPNVILDTNFILRILNLQSEFDVAAATDTLNILVDGQTNFYVLEQTIEEIQTSIKKFLQDIQPYTAQTRLYFQGSNIRMSGFWDAHRRGVSKTDFLELKNKDNLKQALANRVNVTFVEDFDDSTISDEDIEELMTSKNRTGYIEKSARHDLALIGYCKRNRKKKIAVAMDVDWWVLTNDERLAYWNQSHCGDYQECLTEVQFSNLIWLQKKRSTNSGLMQTITSLSNNSAISPQGVVAFASRLHAYQELHKDDKPKLDKFSLLLASNMLTAEDIQRANAADDALDKIIEEKIVKIHVEQKIKQQEFSEAKEEGVRLAAKNEELSIKIEQIAVELEIEKFKRQTDKLGRDIESEKIQLEKQQNNKSNLLRIQEFAHKKIGSTNRYVCMLLAIPIVATLIIYVNYLHPRLADLFKTIDAMPNIVQSILITLFIPFLLICGYYFLVTMIFSTPMSPKKLYESLSSKLLSMRLLHFMKMSGISTEYNRTNLENDILSVESDIQLIERRICTWEKAASEIQKRVEELLLTSS